MVFEQMRQVGVDAIPIVSLLSLTIGVMLGIQFIAALGEFGAQKPGGDRRQAKSITREFGALITGIVVAGRSGSAFAARLGSMVVSQEVDALAVIGIEPVRYLVAPALIGDVADDAGADRSRRSGGFVGCGPVFDRDRWT
jgi:phospholipid/cholesterol/gamma-HCH transport system permease protein